MTFRAIILTTLTLGCLISETAFAQSEPSTIRQRLTTPGATILVLGDSITFAGSYVSMVETQLIIDGRIDPSNHPATFVNMGLPSEGVTGLTEPDHPFPRPNVHTRLNAVLNAADWSCVIACYGMNDGIYHPFSEDRFASYQQGLDALITAVDKHQIPLILMTPPPFDPVPVKSKLVGADAPEFGYKHVYNNYDTEVISKYAQHVREQADRVAHVIDVNTVVTKHLAEQRDKNPEYRLSGDGVHPNASGHAVIAQAILGTEKPPSFMGSDMGTELYKAVSKRNNTRRDGWLSKVGHDRPGMRPGLAGDELKKELERLSQEVTKLTEKLSGS